MSVSFRGKKVLLAAGAGALTAALLGGAALAAFAPVAYDPVSAVEAELGITGPANSGTDKLKAILDALAARGVITIGQVDAILAAVREADTKRDAAKREGVEIKRIFANLFESSAKYLGLTAGDLKTKLPGTSLAAIANSTPGKTRAGLVADLQNGVNAAVDSALAANKITKEQSDKTKAEAPAQIARFVDNVYAQRAPKPNVTKTRALSVVQFVGDVVSAAREYLGVPQADVIKALREGKSVGDIANTTPGKSRDGLVAHVTTVANTKIDKAATDGKITAEQATALKAQVAGAVTALVDRKGSAAKVKR